MRDRPALVRGIERMRADVAGFFGDLEPNVFFRKPEEGWSPEQNLRHLIKSARPVGLALRLPRFSFIFFGRGEGSGPPLDIIRRYLAVLQTGYQAGRAYRPGAGRSSGDQAAGKSADPALAAARDGLVGLYEKECSRLKSALESWSEADLDRYRMPHPATGAITVREMLYFTVFHPYHHMGKLRERLS